MGEPRNRIVRRRFTRPRSRWAALWSSSQTLGSLSRLGTKGGEVLLSYQVGDTRIEEQAWTDASSESTTAMMGRSLRIDPHPTPLRMLIATFTGSSPTAARPRKASGTVHFQRCQEFYLLLRCQPFTKGWTLCSRVASDSFLNSLPSTTSYVGILVLWPLVFGSSFFAS